MQLIEIADKFAVTKLHLYVIGHRNLDYII
jgi:hypothetical protein